MLARRLWISCIVLILASSTVAIYAEESGVRNVLIEAVRPGLEVTVDKGLGATYVMGEILHVNVNSEMDGYLTLFDFTTDGRVHQIFPNQHYQDNWIDSNVDYTIPGNLLPFVFRVGPPEGEELLLAIVASTPFEILPEGSYDFSDVLPLILLGNLSAAETITGSLGIVPQDVRVAVDMTYFTVSYTSGEAPEVANEPTRSLLITSPSGQTTWTAGSDETIHWNAENAGEAVRIEYTTNGALSWTTLLSETANDGEQLWAIPSSIDSDDCRVRVTSNEYPSVSSTSELFTIEPRLESERSLTITVPAATTKWEAGSTQLVRWSSANAGTLVRVDYSADDGATWQVIAISTSNDGSLSWPIPASIDSTRCKVRVTSRAFSEVLDVSSTFTIEPDRTLTITAPTGATAWTAGTTQTIRWSSTNAGISVRVEYSVNNGSTWQTIAGSTNNDGSLGWSIPASTNSTRCKIRITSTAYSEVSDTSASFAIAPEAVSGDVYALFVAISDYKSPENDLTYPVSQNIVTLMRDALDPWIDHVRVLNDGQATRSGILNAIDTFLGQAGPDDTVYFHFVGHGTQVLDLSGDESDDLDEAIAPYDERMITDDEIDDLFQALSAKRAILVFESCHSGTINRGLNAFTIYDPTLTRDVGSPGGTMLDDLVSGSRTPDGPSMRYMVACGPNQNAGYYNVEEGVSYLALYMSLALTEYAYMADDDADNWVSLQEAFGLAARSVSKWVEENTDREQDPMIVDQIHDPVNVVEVED